MKIFRKISQNFGVTLCRSSITLLLSCLLIAAANVHAVNIAGAVVALSDDLKSQRLLFESSRKNVQYNIALGAFKKVNSEWVVDDEQEVYGNIDSLTFEFSTGVPMSEAWDMLDSNFLKSTSNILFTCNGLDCGSSNVWANDYFKIKQLYGLDQSQRYLAIKDELDGLPIYKVLYIVKRGNRRIMAQVDTIFPKKNAETSDWKTAVLTEQVGLSDLSGKKLLHTQEPTTASILQALFQDRYWVFPVGVFNGTLDENRHKKTMDRYVQMIVEALEKRPSLFLYVVGHNNQTVSESIQLRESKKSADILLNMLLDSGVDKARLSTLGLASYVPRAEELGTRVELVVRNSP